MLRRTDDVLDEGFTDLVLVCTNDRDSEYACCADVSGNEVAKSIRGWLREQEVFWTQVYVVETSCLGLCSDGGVAIAIQPRNEWYSNVLPDEVPRLLSEVFGSEATKLDTGSEQRGV